MKIKYKDFLEATVANSIGDSLPELELYSSTVFGLGFLDMLNRFANKVGIHINIEKINQSSNCNFLVEINRKMIKKMYCSEYYIDYYGRLGEELEIEI